jgi:membrane protein implicated in regulation of membrane protease activity
VLFNLVLAALIVLVSWATGGNLGRALVFAALFFVVATAWSWWRFRQRLAKERP